MGKFTDECRQLLELVGGKENISAVTHCVTRMRFVLADPKIADVKAIEALPTTKGTFTQAGTVSRLSLEMKSTHITTTL